MAVRIRLKRAGSRHRPFYKIIVADSRNPRDGAAIESLGYYNPLTHPETVEINEERYGHWISVGASASEPVETLLRRMKRRAAAVETPEELAEPILRAQVVEAEAKGGATETAAATAGAAPAGEAAGESSADESAKSGDATGGPEEANEESDKK